MDVKCTAMTGLLLRLFDMKEGPLGIKSAAPRADCVKLKPGLNSVDATFMTAWLEQNAESDLVKGGLVRRVGEEPSNLKVPEIIPTEPAV